MLGSLYAEGKGVPKDDAKAVHWYTKAAKQGDASAQYMVGVVYYYGDGVPEDHVLAYAWFSIAAAQGDARGKKGETIVAKGMTPTQITEG